MAGIQLSPEQQELIVSLLFSKERGYWLGPYLMGLVFDVILAGVALTQFIAWLGHSKDDGGFTKGCVYSMMISTTVLTLYNIVFQMKCFVYNFGKYAPFVNITTLQGLVIIGIAVYVAAQTFYSQRAYRLLGNSKLFLLVVIPLMMLEFGAELAVVIIANVQHTSLLETDKLTPILLCAFVGQVAVDIVITGSTTYGLWRSKTGWSNTDRLIKKLIMFTVETQLAPTVLAIGFMSYFIGHTNSSFSIFFTLLLNKVYVVGALALLNARSKLRKEMSDPSSKGNSYQLEPTKPSQNSVHVVTETYSQSHTTPYEVGLNRRTTDDHSDDEKDSDMDGHGVGRAQLALHDSRTRLTAH